MTARPTTQRLAAGLTTALAFVLLCIPPLSRGGEAITLRTRSRILEPIPNSPVRVVERDVSWAASGTAVVVCDMWDKHHCPDATERVGEMAPRMNEVLKSARARGMLIIHCPSDTMDFYKDHPGRKLAQSAPKVATKVPLQGWCSLSTGKEPPLPIDDSDGGCDGCPECPSFKAWQRQHPALEIQPGDAITDSAEAYYLMRQRGITNVIVMGVHINMCVLGRPFAIRQLVAQGMNVLLMRDMTDSMYNHRKAPFVSHFRGTELVVEHIEQNWCPSITSVAFLGGEPFRFKGDVRKRIAMIIGENEYHTWETLPAFAKTDLAWRGFPIDLVTASTTEGDANFQNIEALKDASLILVSARRRPIPLRMMELLKAHLDAGRPLVGIRTASHAFDAGKAAEGLAVWPGFDEQILGGNYQGHYNNKPPQGRGTLVEQVRSNAFHVVLTGLKPGPVPVTSHLYKNRRLADTCTVLLQGRVEDQDVIEPVAWVNEAAGRRVFYTSLGSREDFSLPAFRRLLLNGILWALAEPLPPASAEITPVQKQVAPPPTPAPSVVPTRPSAATAPPADVPQETASKPLSPDESKQHFRVAEDLEWDQVLAEPLIRQPVFLNFDERGRMWVVEYRQYPFPAGLTMVSRDSVWRAVYDNVPPPPPNHFKGADRISIHEDTNGDGTYDSHKVFIDGLNIVTSVERGRGGVWILNPPYLLFYRDANGDDIPDGDPEVRLSGFGLEDTHSVANSLRWGPDGWLYAAQGSTVTANIVVHGADGKPLNAAPVYSQGQNIWRYHPEKRVYEVFSEGGGNAFGCEFDSKGRLFSGHNGGDTRGFHYQQGAYLQKGFEKHGPLSNPYAYGYFPAIPHHSVPRFTHNFIVYDHGALPAHYTGHLFGVEPLQGRIVESEITPDGTTFRTRDLGHPVVSDDRWFRPVDIKAGPDGAIYVCDWYDMQVNHFRNHEGRMDAANGRIYRLRSKGGTPGRVESLAGLSPSAWVGRLGDSNRWVRQTALRLLADRHDPALAAPLLAALQEARGQNALETLWALNLSGGLTEAAALKALEHPDPFVRTWTVRLLGDSREVSSAMGERLLLLCRSEPDAEVRSQLASTAKRLPAGRALPLLASLAQHAEDTKDPRIPLLVWWGIESKCESNRDDVVRLFEDSTFWRAPMVESHLIERVSRRFAQAGTRKDLLASARLFELSPSVEHSRRLMTGFEAAFKGRTLAGLPEALVKAMERHGVGSPAFALRQGDPKAIQQALARVGDVTSPRAERLAYLGVMSEVRIPGAVPALTIAYRGVVKDDELRKAMMAALANYDDPSIADVVLSTYPALGPDARAAAQSLLASRPAWGLRLVQAAARKTADGEGIALRPDSIPPTLVRKLRHYRDPGLQAAMMQVWPNEGSPTTAQMEERIRALSNVIRAGKGDPYAGRTLFQAACATCHRLFAQGASVGPDLTVHDRSNLESMLLALVNPSAEIREGYENYSIETRDGRSLSGFLVEQDDRTVVIRGLDNQNQSLARAELLEFKAAGTSLMPEGLLDSLQDQQVRDLFAYLRSTQPLVGEPPKPAPRP